MTWPAWALDPWLWYTVAAAIVVQAWWWFVYHVAIERGQSGDQICMDYWMEREPVPPPYSWRVLLPLLSRPLKSWFPVSYTAVFATSLLVYGYLGGGWLGFAGVLGLLGCHSITMFNCKWPEYVDGLGQCMFIGAIWAMSTGHWSAFILCAAAVATREALGAALGLVALFVNPWLLLPIGLAGGLAYWQRPESDTWRHPLTMDSKWDTVRTWIDKKCRGTAAYHFTTCIQPLRLWPLAIPFTWELVGGFAHVALLAYIPIWLFSLPASGVSRHMSYGFVLVAPFVVVLPQTWLILALALMWFWPKELVVFDESGGRAGRLRKTRAAQIRDGEIPEVAPEPPTEAERLGSWRFPSTRDLIDRVKPPVKRHKSARAARREQRRHGQKVR